METYEHEDLTNKVNRLEAEMKQLIKNKKKKLRLYQQLASLLRDTIAIGEKAVNLIQHITDRW